MEEWTNKYNFSSLTVLTTTKTTLTSVFWTLYHHLPGDYSWTRGYPDVTCAHGLYEINLQWFHNEKVGLVKIQTFVAKLVTLKNGLPDTDKKSD